MSAAPRLLANVGAEDAQGGTPPAAARALARLWCLLFAQPCAWVEGTEGPEAPWPDALGPPPHEGVFAWLREAPCAIAWLGTEAAARAAEEAGLALAGPAPEIVRRVHDKAFAHAVAEANALVPPELRGLVTVLDPAALEPTDAAVRTVQKQLDGWPAWTRGRFALKPRIGGSGRGRVPGEGRADTPALRGALPRLARRGGAILEPWLERRCDLSAQLYVARDGTLSLLATLEQRVSAAGVYRGHNGVVDHRGRITSGHPRDAALMEAAVVVAGAANGEGFHGPCGIDAFTFEGPEGVVLRPVVEFNARFTAGTVVAGLVRRALPQVAGRIGLRPGEPRAFHFALDAPPRGWSSSEEIAVLTLGEAEDGLRPGLALGRDRETLEAHLGY